MPDDIKLKDYGRLIRDGELRIKDHSTMKVRSRYVFVFDQVVIMCKSKVCSCRNFGSRLTVVKNCRETSTNSEIVSVSRTTN
jgi:hypothetical protein